MLDARANTQSQIIVMYIHAALHFCAGKEMNEAFLNHT